MDVYQLDPNTSDLRSLANYRFATFKRIALFVHERLNDYNVANISHHTKYDRAPEGAQNAAESIAKDMLDDAEEQGIACKNLRRILRDMIFLVAPHLQEESPPTTPRSETPTRQVNRQPLATLTQSPLRPKPILASLHQQPLPQSPPRPKPILASSKQQPIPQSLSDTPNAAPTSTTPSSDQSFGGVKRILCCLLNQLENDEDRGYSQWLKSTGPKIGIGTKLMAVVQGNKNLSRICTSRSFADKRALLGLRTNEDPTNCHSPGWYMNIVTDQQDAAYMRLYIGQAEDVGERIKEHIRIVKTNRCQSLHYSILRKPGRIANYVLLGKTRIRATKDLEMALNIGEMLWALVFQSLPIQALEKYLPKGSRIRTPHIGLNVATPLNQGHKERAKMALNRLKVSSDPEVRQYYKSIMEVNTERMQSWNKDDNYLAQIRGIRNRPRSAIYNGHYHPPDPERGRPDNMHIMCSKCRDPEKAFVDPAPTYTESGLYLARKRGCSHAQADWIPVERTVPFTSQETYREYIKTHIIPFES